MTSSRTVDRGSVLDEVGAGVASALASARGMTSTDCRRLSLAEGWPAVVVAYHIGLGLRRQAGFIGRALTKEVPFEFESEPTHDLNAVNAREHAAISAGDAATEIEDGWTRLRAVVDRMSEKDWEREVFAFDGRARSADFVLRRIVLPHVIDHLESLRRTLAEVPPSA